jgi:hypothetical protein
VTHLCNDADYPGFIVNLSLRRADHVLIERLSGNITHNETSDKTALVSASTAPLA